jgi:large repetitive protein
MVSAINFAARTSAGTTQLGSVAGEGQSNLIAVQPGQSISLNLSPGSVVAYKQQGSDLVVQLTDGRTIVLSNYFATPEGVANKLYLSSNDEIVEVRVADGVDGVLFADYGPSQAMEKWSPLDNLRFSESDVLSDMQLASNEPAGMAMLVPGLLAGGGTAAGLGGLGTAAAALAGGALLVGGVGGGGGTGTGTGTGTGGSGGSGTAHTPPTVDPRAATTLNTNTNNPSVVVTGTGHPGDTVVVTVGGVTRTTTITSGGTWNVTLTNPNLPPDGTYVPSVVVTNSVTGGTTTLTGSTYIIDMTPPLFAVQDGTTSAGDIHNIATYVATGGLTVISGTGEVGATMRVTANGHTQTAVVGSNGTWSVSFTQTQLPGGEFHQVPVQITATDINGNVSAPFNTNIAIDTVANPIAVTAVAGDGTVNMVESQNGFAVTGTSVAGAQLTVTIGTSSQIVTVGVNGQWTANFGAGVATQNGMATMTLSSTDAAGNPSTQTHQFRIDTQATATLNATQAFGGSINASEAAAGVNIVGSADANSSVVVNFEGQTRTVVADANGNWTANFTLAHLVGAGAVERNGTVTVTATDPYGNVAQTSQSIAIDTLAPTDPFVTGDLGNNLSLNGVVTAHAPGNYDYFSIGSNGIAQQVPITLIGDTTGRREDSTIVASELAVFATPVPDGTYLVIRDVDAAGNESSTLYLRSGNEVTVDLTRAGLQGFDFGTINLVSADANLTLNTARVLALTGADKQITVTGTSDDVVNLIGGTSTGATTTANGETYRLYTLGSGASVLVDDDITVNLVP